MVWVSQRPPAIDVETDEEMARWSFWIGATDDGLRRRREWRSCSGWLIRDRTRRSWFTAAAAIGIVDGNCVSSIIEWLIWGWDVSHVTPVSTLCHLLFCCNAVLICTQSSLLQDCDLKHWNISNLCKFILSLKVELEKILKNYSLHIYTTDGNCENIFW